MRGHSQFSISNSQFETCDGLVIGGGQALALRRYVRRSVLWIAATAFAGGAGFPLGFIVARLFSPLSDWIGVRLFGYLLLVRAIGMHAPDLHRSGAIGIEVDKFSVRRIIGSVIETLCRC